MIIIESSVDWEKASKIPFEHIKEYVLKNKNIGTYITDINIPEARQLIDFPNDEEAEEYIEHLFYTGFFSLREIKFLLLANKKMYDGDYYNVDFVKKYIKYLDEREGKR